MKTRLGLKFVLAFACACLAKPQTMPPALAQTTEPQLIDIDVVDTPVKNLLNILVQEGIFIGVIGELRGTFTLSLHQRTPAFILQVITDAKGVAVTKLSETAFVIHPKDVKVTVFSPIAKK